MAADNNRPLVNCRWAAVGTEGGGALACETRTLSLLLCSKRELAGARSNDELLNRGILNKRRRDARLGAPGRQLDGWLATRPGEPVGRRANCTYTQARPIRRARAKYQGKKKSNAGQLIRMRARWASRLRAGRMRACANGRQLAGAHAAQPLAGPARAHKPRARPGQRERRAPHSSAASQPD